MSQHFNVLRYRGRLSVEFRGSSLRADHKLGHKSSLRRSLRRRWSSASPAGGNRFFRHVLDLRPRARQDTGARKVVNTALPQGSSS